MTTAALDTSTVRSACAIARLVLPLVPPGRVIVKLVGEDYHLRRSK